MYLSHSQTNVNVWCIDVQVSANSNSQSIAILLLIRVSSHGQVVASKVQHPVGGCGLLDCHLVITVSV